MRRIRPRSVYDVLALMSFFLVLGGGTALASFVVSSNSQVGPGTISGHNPPAGKHQNIIAGSLSNLDLASGAITTRKLVNFAVTHGKLAPNAVNGTDVLDNSLTGADINESTLGKVPSASAADSATNADNATSANHATNANHATSADNATQATNANTVNGKSAAELEGARASAIVQGDNCAVGAFCPILRNRGVAYAFHAATGKYCVGVSGIPANDPKSLALISSVFPQPNEWGYWRPAVYGSNSACVASEYEIYMIYQGSGFANLAFTIVIP
jgi:hypothetical protein